MKTSKPSMVDMNAFKEFYLEDEYNKSGFSLMCGDSSGELHHLCNGKPCVCKCHNTGE